MVYPPHDTEVDHFVQEFGRLMKSGDDRGPASQVAPPSQVEPLQVVCGAPNVRVGGKYPLAPVGARLPGDFRIKKSKLRGVESYGMLCSARELGLSEEEGVGRVRCSLLRPMMMPTPLQRSQRIERNPLELNA